MLYHAPFQGQGGGWTLALFCSILRDYKGNVMDLVINLLILALDIYFWIIILTVVVSWLVIFEVLNTRNKWVLKGCNLLNTITNPLVMRLRKVIKPIGGVDVTPMVIIFGIYFLQMGLRKLLIQ
jgi:YggT family protein